MHTHIVENSYHNEYGNEVDFIWFIQTFSVSLEKNKQTQSRFDQTCPHLCLFDQSSGHTNLNELGLKQQRYCEWNTNGKFSRTRLHSHRNIIRFNTLRVDTIAYVINPLASINSSQTRTRFGFKPIGSCNEILHFESAKRILKILQPTWIFTNSHNTVCKFEGRQLPFRTNINPAIPT